MYLLILGLPLISAVSLLSFGRFFGKVGAFVIVLSNICCSLLLSGYLFYILLSSNTTVDYTLGVWMNYVQLFSVKWVVSFDLLSISMVTTVLLVSSLVHMYSWSYMQADPFLIRFLALLSLFTFFMLVLLVANNFLQLFLGWEGIGLCSYFLIGFWYTRIQANKSALKALFINRLGDIALLISIGTMVYSFQTTDFSVIFALVPYMYNNCILVYSAVFPVIDIVCFWLMLAAVGKSAQLGLHIWLPDAMEGPTPVSALIHAATMVTAGIFLLIRCSFIFEYSPTVLLFVSLLGAITAIFAASTGLVQNDIKKIIAYSTCSQLGYMFCACGFSNYIGSLFHLINHAFFKALLFLSSGVIIHALNDEQDIRKMGRLGHIIPVVYVCILIGSLALVGFPFLSGFYSKDFILEHLYVLGGSSLSALLALILLLITAILTILYSARLFIITFFSFPNAQKTKFFNLHFPNVYLLAPLVILSCFSISSGFLFKDIFIFNGSSFFENAIYIAPKQTTLFDVESLLTLKVLIVGFNFISCLFFFFFYSFIIFVVDLTYYKSFFYYFLIYKWYFDFVSFTITRILFNVSFWFMQLLDKGFLELVKPIFFTSAVNFFSLELLQRVNSSNILGGFIIWLSVVTLFDYAYFF